METTTPPWLDPDAETIPTFEPSGMAGRADDAARSARRLLVAAAIGWVAVVTALGAVLVIGLAYFASIDGWKAAQLRERDHSAGRVVDIDGSGDGDDGRVRVRFGPDDDHLRWVWVTTGDVGRYSVGRTVTVLVDPATGSVTLPGENFTPEWFETLAAWIVIGAIGLGGTGILLLRRTVPMGRALSRSPWLTTEVRHWRVTVDDSSKTFVHVPAIAAGTVFRVTGLRSLTGVPRRAGTTILEVAGDADGIALRRPGHRGRGLGRPDPGATVR